jgi:histidinol dehydrogenase
LRRITLAAGQALTQADLNRSGALPREVMESAAAIVDDVRERGDAAVREYCQRFDGACPSDFRVPQELVDAAPGMVDAEFLSSLRRAYRQIREFHERQRENSWFETRPDGTILGVKVTPLDSVAIYVPGGRAQYPSTVLMDAIPAKVAGVGRVVMVTPPQHDGTLSAYTLAAASVAGVDEVYAVGGAQAIGAVAYGTESIPRVDKVVGPGNAYVAAAKRHVSGDVGIDMIAGPSEVCVLADASADPVVVAADLMAQAEHDPMAVLLPRHLRRALPDRVLAAVERLVSQSPREKITRASLDDRGVVVVAATLADAVGGRERGRPGAPRAALRGRHVAPGLGPQRRAPSSWAPGAPSPWATTLPAPTTRFPPAAPRASPTPWASTTSRSTRASSPTRRRGFLRMLLPSRPWPRPRASGRMRFPPAYA